MDITTTSSSGEVNNTPGPVSASAPPAPIASATIVPPLPSPVLIKGGVQINDVPEFPLVAINKCAGILNAYNLFITIIIPAGSINVTLDTSLSTSEIVQTEAGPLDVREITIDYDAPNTDTSSSGYDIYLIECTYQLASTGTPAQAVYVHYTYNDPVTTRGTITTVMTT